MAYCVSITCFLVLYSLVLFNCSARVPVRLSYGTNKYEGRVEVFHAGEWGTVCDDYWTNQACVVVCRQLGYRGGEIMNYYHISSTNESEAMSLRIWLDDVSCTGSESSLDECSMNPGGWGFNNCEHLEDAGCACRSTSTRNTGYCETSRYRITAQDPGVPWVGRAEIQQRSSKWVAICDDNWNDETADLFCRCLGYNTTSKNRAYWSRELAAIRPEIELGYDEVQCSVDDVGESRNLWECSVVVEAQGRCTPEEAAGVVCGGPLPVTHVLGPPNVTLSCDGRVLTTCFDSDMYAINYTQLVMRPSCLKVTHTNHTSYGICVYIPLTECASLNIHEIDNDVNMSLSNYCYQIRYMPHVGTSHVRATEVVWERRACCSVMRTGSVRTHLTPVLPNESMAALTAVNFSLTCYRDEAFSQPLVQPYNVSRGDVVYCAVEAHVWDALLLVVPRCQLAVGEHHNDSPVFDFVRNRCPTTHNLAIAMYSLSERRWGFRLAVPVFHGHNTLHLSCSSFVCDRRTDDKRHCDRTCSNMHQHLITRRRRSHDITKMSFDRDAEVNGGYIAVKDVGSGPIIYSNGSVLVVPRLDSMGAPSGGIVAMTTSSGTCSQLSYSLLAITFIVVCLSCMCVTLVDTRLA